MLTLYLLAARLGLSQWFPNFLQSRGLQVVCQLVLGFPWKKCWCCHPSMCGAVHKKGVSWCCRAVRQVQTPPRLKHDTDTVTTLVGLVVGFWLSLDLDSELDLGLSLSLVLDYRRCLFILPFTWLYITSFVSLHNTDLHHTFAIIIR